MLAGALLTRAMWTGEVRRTALKDGIFIYNCFLDFLGAPLEAVLTTKFRLSTKKRGKLASAVAQGSFYIYCV